MFAAPAAPGHGGAVGPKGFVSTVTGLRPPVPGLKVTILGGDERMRVENRSGKTVVIEGYDGEPYLRFGPDGTYVNLRSPATTLNEDRFGTTPVPPDADPAAPPDWLLYDRRQAFEWHEHRAQWMNRKLPPSIRISPGEPRFMFEWAVPGTVDGRPLTIAGTLDYSPVTPVGSSFPWAAVAGAATVGIGVFAAGLLIAARNRDRREDEAAAAP